MSGFESNDHWFYVSYYLKGEYRMGKFLFKTPLPHIAKREFEKATGGRVDSITYCERV